MLDAGYREQFSDALAVVVSDQERAGLDIVTCGDYFLDADLAGRSWHHFPRRLDRKSTPKFRSPPGPGRSKNGVGSD
jgi:hypothetical protein